MAIVQRIAKGVLMPPKPTARVGSQGYIQVAIAEPPGCLARIEAWLKRVAWAGAWFAAGVLVGLVLR